MQARLPGVHQQLLQSFFKVAFARECTSKCVCAQTNTVHPPSLRNLKKKTCKTNDAQPGFYTLASALAAKLRQLWSCLCNLKSETGTHSRRGQDPRLARPVPPQGGRRSAPGLHAQDPIPLDKKEVNSVWNLAS